MQQHSRKLVGAALAVVVGMSSTALVAAPAEANRGARVKGTVSVVVDSVEVPLANVLVTAWENVDSTWVEVDRDVTTETGGYNLGKLTDGTYHVRYDDQSGSYATEYYDDADRIEDSTAVVLDTNQFRTINPVLEPAAHVLGKVTGSDDLPLANAEVTAYVPQGASWTAFRKVVTGSDGTYDLGGLSAGDYVLGFWDPVSGVSEYWEDAAQVLAADEVTVPVAPEARYDAKLATPVPAPVDPTPVTPAPAPAAPTTTTPAASVTTTTTTTTAPAAIAVLKKPRIRGKAKVGQRLRVTRGTWAPTTVKRKLQWFANGKRIKGATKNRLRLTAKLVGKRISVRVIASAPGLTAVKVTTRKTKKVVA